MKTKEIKFLIKKETDPTIFEWMNSLKYGVPPKVMLNMLRWYDRKNLLCRGGIIDPDTVIVPQDINSSAIGSDELIRELLAEIKSLKKELANLSLSSISKQASTSPSASVDVKFERERIAKAWPDEQTNQSNLNLLSEQSLDNKSSLEVATTDPSDNPSQVAMPRPAFKVYKRDK